MRKNFAGILVLLMVFAAPLALAKGDKGGGRGHGDHGHDHGHDHGDSTPPGWEHGEKKGWDGADMPPGLLKKEEGAEHEKGPGKKREKKKKT